MYGKVSFLGLPKSAIMLLYGLLVRPHQEYGVLTCREKTLAWKIELAYKAPYLQTRVKWLVQLKKYASMSQ